LEYNWDNAYVLCFSVDEKAMPCLFQITLALTVNDQCSKKYLKIIAGNVNIPFKQQSGG
jgi:hypothetical protein